QPVNLTLLFGGAGLILISMLIVMHVYNEQPPIFELFKQWEKIAGQLLDAFPMSVDQVRAYAPWAEAECLERARFVSAAFAAQELNRKQPPTWVDGESLAHFRSRLDQWEKQKERHDSEAH